MEPTRCIEFGKQAMDEARAAGAVYADIRLMTIRAQMLNVKRNVVSDWRDSTSVGFGVRARGASGVWGFAASSLMTADEVIAKTRMAVEMAQTSAGLKGQSLEWAAEPAYQDTWKTPYQIDPFQVSVEEKISFLQEIDRILYQKSEIKDSICMMTFEKEWQVFVNSEGSVIEQEILISGSGFDVTAVGNSDIQTRSFPMSFGGQHRQGGYEVVLGLSLKENAARVRDEAIALLTADPCPSMTTDLILANDQLFLQIHESVGHPNELDRVLGWEANFAGRSFNEPSHLRDFQYGSEIVNFVVDSGAPSGVGTLGYDDDGVRAQKFDVVKDGIFMNYFTTRDTAPLIHQARSNGCSRADGWSNAPINRIPNLSLMPSAGAMTLDDLIASTDQGIYMETNRSWSIDQLRLNFQFGCEAAWEIKSGRKGRLLKNPNYQGMTPQFWRSCDAVCGANAWDLMGVLQCGKGQPMQTAAMSHGCAPARFRGVQVGITSGRKS